MNRKVLYSLVASIFALPALATAGPMEELYRALSSSDFRRAKVELEKVKELQKSSHSVQIDLKYPIGQPHAGTLLYYAAREGQTQILEGLLSAGADPNTFNGRYASTPLQSAANRDDIPSVKLLLRAGARIGEKNNAQNTCLHTAINNRKLAVLSVLLESATLQDLQVKDARGIDVIQLAKTEGIQEVEQRVQQLSGRSLGRKEPPSQTIKAHLLNRIANGAATRATYRMNEVQIEQLDANGLLEVVNEACKARQESNFAAKLCFDARDEMIRRSSEDPALLAKFKANCNDPLIKELDFSKSQFHGFESYVKGNLNPSSVSNKMPTKMPANIKDAKLALAKDFDLANLAKEKKKTLVFHGSVSYHGTAGGMGAFLESFIHSQEKHLGQDGKPDTEGRELTAFYEFLKLEMFGPKTRGGKDLLPQIKFAGFVDHEVDGNLVRSSVYETTTDGIRQYLIQPDPRYQVLQTSEKGSDILVNGRYDTYNETGKVYFSGAMAAMAALYRGENNNETVNILMAHDRNMVMLPPLMRLQYNEKRKEAGLPAIPTVSVIHTQNGLNYSKVQDSTFTRLGLPKPKAQSIPLFTTQAVFADMTLAVSRAYARELSSKAPHGKDLGLGEMYSDLEIAGLFGGITSGIETERFSPSDPHVMGSVAVKSDHSDYTEKKEQAKKELFKAGIIASPTKPLFLYVGRFDEIKGIDTLPAFAKMVVKNGGQVVIMGPGLGTATPRPVAEVIRMQSDPQYDGMIKVYTDYEKDQKAPLDSVGAKTKRGHLIRFASDFTFVPSVSEACGLVPIESFAMGSGLITSYVSGLKDLCKPINRKGPAGEVFDSSSFSCVAFDRSYPDFSKTVKDLESNVEDFLGFWDQLPAVEKEGHHKRWISEAKTFAWNHPQGAMDQYQAVFTSLQTPETEAEKQIHDDLIERWVPLHYDTSR